MSLPFQDFEYLKFGLAEYSGATILGLSILHPTEDKVVEEQEPVYQL